MAPLRFGAAAIYILALAATLAAEQGGEKLELIEVRRIWDAAPHNAFTDLIRFQNRWFCTFREGQRHVSPDGKLRVLTSEDGETWQSAALIEHADGDLRDPKLSITPQGQLMLNGAIAWHKPRDGHSHRSMVWFSDDGRQWSSPTEIGDAGNWIWSVTWDGKTGYGVGYGCGKDRIARLYHSADGQRWETLAPDLLPGGGYPTEASLLFEPDGTGRCLLRRDGKDTSGKLGTAQPPYTEWQWQDLGARIGGPKMIRLANGKLLATVRLHDTRVRTAVCWVDPQAGTLNEALALPSSGDSSYAGMVQQENVAWISYYSSHEGKSAIYLAKVKLP